MDPALPEWSQVAGWFENRDWDLGQDMQAFARPDGAERTMAYDADARGWVRRPREPKRRRSPSLLLSQRRRRTNLPREEGDVQQRQRKTRRMRTARS